MNPQQITITTSDRYVLAGNYWQGTTHNAVIYLHQFRRDKNDVQIFLPELLSRGYHVLSIDLRGHGQSQGERDKFSDEDFKAMFADAKSAYEFLESIHPTMSVQMIGSSIGANTALIYQEMNTLESVVAISPSLNYHGIMPEASNLSNIAMPIMYITSAQDSCARDTKQLYEDSPVTPDGLNLLKEYPGNAHGIDIIRDNKQALADIISWLDAHAGKGLAQMKTVPKN
ncbi:alpha/beta fold hydrolase [Candidatus Falkowbacteria bacterium]|nr:alpha/beta fold hydrolase [Candidatus Falkowbacteria bacterium]